jgi:hypothetical protein
MLPPSAFRSVKFKVIEFDANFLSELPADGDWYYPVRHGRPFPRATSSLFFLDEAALHGVGMILCGALEDGLVLESRKEPSCLFHSEMLAQD